MEGKRPAIHSILRWHHTRALGHCLSRLLESQVGHPPEQHVDGDLLFHPDSTGAR
jgi:hypothetical protein